jgi:transposase-like protein
MKEVVRYSEAFKRSVVEKMESGIYATMAEARRKNGIRGSETLVSWIKKYGREDILPKRIKVESMNEIDELKAAKKEIKELKAALADAHMDWCLESAFLDIACEKIGTTAEALKKKNPLSLADARKKRGP